MKHLDEYRDASLAARLANAIRRATTRPWAIMEICGGQTHSIVRFGVDELLPPGIELIHGPGCPVCVTPIELIDKAIELAARPDVILCSFGDMMRVPGSRADLLAARAAGGDARMVYSPLDAVGLARANPARQVVFFAVGFETTAPATAIAVQQADALGIQNFSMLVAHVRVPPAIEALLGAADCRVQGLLAAGHVCAIAGTREYEPLARQFGVPIVVTGFEPVDLLRGLLACVRQLEAGRAEVENAYARVVRPEGNPSARRAVEQVYAVCDRRWRGLGTIERGGLALRPEYAAYDAERRFGAAQAAPEAESECIAGLVLRGAKTPRECPAFAVRCTPERPLGAPMVSSEGTCAAFYRYRRPR
jgi:hydrogenase expression/formation protein HypD